MTDHSPEAAKLLPCPLCEGSAEMQDFQHMHYAMCFACGTKGPLQPSVEKAAAAWNTRQQPLPPQGEPLADDVTLALCRWLFNRLEIGQMYASSDNPDAEATFRQLKKLGFVKQYDAYYNNTYYALTDKGRRAIGPHPEPTQDEPDFLAIARDIENCAFDHGWPAEVSHEDYIKGLADWLKNRLGAASRPKVEDAEVAKEISLIDGFLAGTHGTDKPSFRLYMRRWSDLLERLALDLKDAEIITRAERDNYESQLQMREAAEAALAEREVELAKVDMLIFKFANLTSPPFQPWSKDQPTATDWEAALERHAARQRQKGLT